MSEEFVFEAEHLTAGYPGRLVLHDLSFSVRSGELVGIIGANGAGKSTLMKTLRGMLPPQEGDVRLYGRKIRDIPGRSLRGSPDICSSRRPSRLPIRFAISL